MTKSITRKYYIEHSTISDNQIACQHLVFDNNDYRKIDVDELNNTALYVHDQIHLTGFPKNITYFFLQTIYNWNDHAPSDLQNVRCKNCMYPTNTCKHFSANMKALPDCDGS